VEPRRIDSFFHTSPFTLHTSFPVLESSSAAFQATAKPSQLPAPNRLET
jgi:hypothetical protein